MKQYFIRLVPSVVLLVVFALHAGGGMRLQLIDKLEQFSYDTRLNLTRTRAFDKRIVIVDIDEASLRAEGHWPWSRHRLAELVDRLFTDYAISVLGVDVFFFETERAVGIDRLKDLAIRDQSPDFLARLDSYTDLLDGDKALAAAIKNNKVVLSYFFGHALDGVSESTGLLPAPVFTAEEYLPESIDPGHASYYLANIDVLQQAAYDAGFINLETTDSDGVVRRASLLHEYGGALYSSFALAVARAYTEAILIPLFAQTRGTHVVEAFELAGQRVPVNRGVNVLIPYRGTYGENYIYLSATDVLRDRIPNPVVLHDAIVLLGTSAAGLGDLKSTPVQEIFPGVEIHANIVSGLLDGDFKHRPLFTRNAEVGLLLFIGLLLTIVMPMLAPVAVSLFVLSVLATTVGVNFYLWQVYGLDLPLASSVVLILLLAGINATYGFAVEYRLEHQLKKAFSSYLAPALVERLAKNPEQLHLQGETRTMSFLFTDVSDFTRFVEHSTPQQVVTTHNEYLDNVCRIIMDHGGTIDKIVGDAVIAIYNAPLDQPDHAVLAVRCSLALDRFGREFVQRCERDGIAFGYTRAGVNTGSAVVGNFGGQRRFDYTAYGDVVNTTARLEAANKALGTRVCVAEATVAQCPDVVFRPVGQLLLRGKKTTIAAFEPVLASVAPIDNGVEYNNAYELLVNDPGQALDAFEQLLNRYPQDALTQLYVSRLQLGVTGTIINLSSA